MTLRLKLRLLVLAVLVIELWVPLGAFAQGSGAGVSAEDLKLYQSLPQEQKDALMQQLGLKGSRAGGSGPAVSGPDNQITVNTAPGSGDDPSGKYAGLPGMAKIKGREELLVEVVLPEDAKGFDANGIAAVEPAIQQNSGQGAAVLSAGQKKKKEAEYEKDKRTPEQLAALRRKRDLIRAGNPYKLSEDGVLLLPDLAPINLLGLTAKEVQQRLSLDPLLREFRVGVTLLRTEARGVEALKPFGYEVFKGAASAFVPGTDIPAPQDYVVGPGDTVDVELYGQKTNVYTLPVGRDGFISIPDVGPVQVGGSSVASVTSQIQKRVSQQFIGTQARVSLKELRSARVLVLGDAERPGNYVVSGLSTVMNALFAGGGVKPIGTLRNIEVKRGGRLVRRLDLYDVLLHGNTSDNVSLQTGDVVFIPPVGTTVGISGDVRRPAIYELSGERTVGEVVQMAGGLSPDADPHSVSIERVSTETGHRMLSVDLAESKGRGFVVQAGDVIRIAPQRASVDNGVTVEGYVYRPRTVAYRPGQRLSDVLPSVDELKPNADLRYLLIRRESTPNREVSVLSADLTQALAKPGMAPDIPLQPRDRISVFELQGTRDRVVMPLIEELKRQSGPRDYAAIVSIAGHVNAAGKYPLEPGMKISDLLRAGGGLQDNAYAQAAELTRYAIAPSGERRVELVNVDLARALGGDATADVVLQPYDSLTVKVQPEWRTAEEVEFAGEVRFPGIYQIRRGETLRALIDRAGGLTSLAFAKGAVFSRLDLKEKEREQIDRLSSRMQADLASLSLQNSQTNPLAPQQFSAGQALLDQLQETKPVGRMVIDLQKVMANPPGSEWDITLRNGDKLTLPRITQEVSVLGEVQSPTSHLYRPNLSRDDYVSLSGGVTQRGDRARTYVVKADGSVVTARPGFLRGQTGQMDPGDTVVVPFDAEKMRPLPLWTAVTTIIYNLAVATAAVARF
jgi:polysaccharide biosynthesis/export protein